MSIRRRSFVASAAAASLGAALPANAQRSGPPRSDALYRSLLSAIDRIAIVNTHEHLIAEMDRLKAPRDPFLLVSHYLINDLVSAGLPADDAVRVADANAPLEKRFALFAPWWKAVRHTGYAEAFHIALRDLYGVEEISLRGFEHVREQMANLKAGFYNTVLQKRANIAYSVLDDYWNGEPTRPDPELFVLARKFDWFVAPRSRRDLTRMEEVTGIAVTSLADLKRALEKRIEQNLAVGMVTIKSTIAYQRSLAFEPATEADASRAFALLAARESPPPSSPREATQRPLRALEDHMFHYLLDLAAQRRLPFQVHTGIQAGNGNHLPNSRPSLLTETIRMHPDVPFDLFHIGYPWTGEVTALTKMFPNVHADFCWAWVLSPTTARRALGEMLDAVPFTKIMGFGGDYRYVELTYGHARMARQNIARVLAELVEDRAFEETAAIEIAQAILAKNPARLFPKGA
ncbi:MAG: amidohydrolase family protein [Bryobacterales bacterium]|nr:amidohydrolase family protein [Bryobacterales bacterium]